MKNKNQDGAMSHEKLFAIREDILKVSGNYACDIKTSMTRMTRYSAPISDRSAFAPFEREDNKGLHAGQRGMGEVT